MSRTHRFSPALACLAALLLSPLACASVRPISLEGVFKTHLDQSMKLALSASDAQWIRSTPDDYALAPDEEAHLASRQGAELVARVQAALLARDYDPGPIDGLVGVLTETALFSFQMDAELDVTGAINAATLKRLQIKPPEWLSR